MSYKPDLLHQLLFQPNDTFHLSNQTVDRSEADRLDYEIEEHFKMLEEQNHPMIRDKRVTRKDYMQANEPSMNAENLL